MKSNKYRIMVFLILFSTIFAILFLKQRNLISFLLPVVFAHCDTMDGPVVKDAKLALEKANVTPVLKWVKPEREAEIMVAFEKALDRRKVAPEAKEEADMEFFETLIRIHREGEGAGFEGIKPSGSEVEPAIIEADKALEEGTVDNLVKLITDDAARGIKERFDKALEKRKHKDESVEAGREYVEAYVEFIHYVEGLHNYVSGKISHHDETEDVTSKKPHQH